MNGLIDTVAIFEKKIYNVIFTILDKKQRGECLVSVKHRYGVAKITVRYQGKDVFVFNLYTDLARYDGPTFGMQHYEYWYSRLSFNRTTIAQTRLNSALLYAVESTAKKSGKFKKARRE